MIAAVESDPLASLAYRMNHQNTFLWEVDIRKLTGSEILERLNIRTGEVDLLAACPPCQGFSSIRTRNGSSSNRDPRNALIFQVSRFAAELQPKAIMLENVPGLAQNRQFSKFCNQLNNLGYDVTWLILDASNYGVPQRRRRLVLLASKFGLPNFANPSRTPKTVADAIRRLEPPSKSKDPLHSYRTERSDRIARLIRMIPVNGGSRKDLGSKQQLPCHKRINGFWDVYGRMSWDHPSPTITGGCINPSKGRFLHPSANRPITLREAALLQTFPKSYRFPLDRGRFAVALMIGNALPPEFICRHAKALRKHLLSAAAAK